MERLKISALVAEPGRPSLSVMMQQEEQVAPSSGWASFTGTPDHSRQRLRRQANST